MVAHRVRRSDYCWLIWVYRNVTRSGVGGESAVRFIPGSRYGVSDPGAVRRAYADLSLCVGSGDASMLIMEVEGSAVSSS